MSLFQREDLGDAQRRAGTSQGEEWGLGGGLLTQHGILRDQVSSL